MKHIVLLLALLLVLTGCDRISRESTVIWAKMGTVGKIVDGDDCIVLIMVGDEYIPVEADLTGMVAIDEPTLEALMKGGD